MKVHCNEGVAIRIGPEPCVGIREDDDEASVGEHIGQLLSRESLKVPGVDVFGFAEDNMDGCVSTLASSVLADDRNTAVVLGEIQRQIEACPAEPAYMKLSKSNRSSGASTSGTALFARATATVRSVAREFSRCVLESLPTANNTRTAVSIRASMFSPPWRETNASEHQPPEARESPRRQ